MRSRRARQRIGLRNINIQTRLVAAVLLLSVIPLLIVGLYAYNIYTNSINLKLRESMMQSLALVDSNVSKELEKIEFLCGQITILPEVQEYLSSYEELDLLTRREITVRINNMFAQHVTLSNYVKNVYIITAQGQVFYYFGFDSLIGGTVEFLIEEINRTPQIDYWTYATTQRGAGSLILGRKINSLKRHSICIGYVLIVVNERQFRDRTYGDTTFGDGSQLFIIDENGLVLSTNSEDIKTGNIYPEEKLITTIKKYNNRSGNFNLKLDDKNKLVGYIKNGYTEWYTVSTIPFSYINSETSRLTKSLFVVCIGLILFSLFIMFFIVTSIISPIRKLVSYTNLVSEGNFDVEIGDQYNDEIGILSNAFDNMVKKIIELIREVRFKEQRQRELEIDVLRYQINPHFLFNTLDSLKMVAVMSRVKTISKGLEALSQLLKNTIYKDKQFFTLKEELRNIESYIFIQRIRYGDSFTVDFDIEEQLMDALILKLLLQPIVENSIIHGMSERIDHLNISIKAYEDDNMMIIKIIDDGVGFDTSKLRQKPKDAMTGIGLENIRERIKLHFGKPYGLYIESELGKGTTCTLKLPINYEEV